MQLLWDWLDGHNCLLRSNATYLEEAFSSSYAPPLPANHTWCLIQLRPT